MNKKQRHTLILIILIVLCIWQTGKLWLGNMSSLNFFIKPVKSTIYPIEPYSIWLNPGAPNTFIYRLGEENREYQSVYSELEKNIRTYVEESKIQKPVPLNWGSVLAKQGILYEYAMPLTYGEVIGKEAVTTPSNLPSGEKIDYIFMQLSEDQKGMMKWYFISSQEELMYPLELQGQFGNIQRLGELLKEESLSMKTKYQPAFNMKGINRKSLFLPICSKEMPFSYDVLQYHNPLREEKMDQDEDFNRFNPYVNHFFLNPLLKKEEKTEDGVYIFSELMKAVVKYYPNGVFEYSNIGVTEIKNKVSRLRAYTIAKQFLLDNESITKEVKKKLFLADIVPTDTGYIVCFDMRIGGIPIYFAQKTRERFGMEHMVEVTVYGSQISNFKWNASILEPKHDEYSPIESDFTMKYIDGINKVLEYVAQQQETSTLAIDDMKWVYMMNEKEDEDIHIRWIVLHENKWYSP